LFPEDGGPRIPLLKQCFSTAGSNVMKRIAAPRVGGIFTSFLMELMVYPAVYQVWRWHFRVKHGSR
jgi:Cu/Ag efflux pump CusA